VDYEHAAGEVLFGQYYSLSSFTIPILWDRFIEPDETVEVVLRSGPGLPIKDRAVLTIRNAGAQTVVWIDDAVPLGMVTNGLFEWITNAPPPLSGTRAHSGSPHGFETTNNLGLI